MKIAILISRILLGILFVFSGANGILHFIKGSLPPGDGNTFATILATHNYFTFIALLMLIAGILLLVGRFVPLGLTILAPILVNILCFHIFLQPSGISAGIIATLLEIFLIWAYRLSFRGLFDAAPEVS
jgi:putative oxidoreductase